MVAGFEIRTFRKKENEFQRTVFLFNENAFHFVIHCEFTICKNIPKNINIFVCVVLCGVLTIETKVYNNAEHIIIVNI